MLALEPDGTLSMRELARKLSYDASNLISQRLRADSGPVSALTDSQLSDLRRLLLLAMEDGS